MPEKSKLIFFDFFQSLRLEVGIELDFQQYQLFLELFLSGKWKKKAKKDEDLELELYRLCQTLWLTKTKFQSEFKNRFEQAFSELSDYWSHQFVEGEKKGMNLVDEPHRKKDVGSYKIPKQSLPVDDSIENPKLADSSEVFLNFSKGKGRKKYDEKLEGHTSVKEVPFLFSDDKHLPVSLRRATNLLKNLKNNAARVKSDKIDVKKTVLDIARNNAFLEPVFQKNKVFQNHLVLIIDHMGSMIPFAGWSEYLVELLIKGNRKNQANVFYINDAPIFQNNAVLDYYGFLLFANPQHTKSINLKQLFSIIDSNTALIIFSDAGALHTVQQEDLVRTWWSFLDKVGNRVNSVVWINPMRKERWSNTNAEIISYFTKMIEFDETGLRQLTNLLH